MFFSTSQEVDSSSPLESAQLCREFTFSEIKVATHDFDESLVIGRGGFGKVYKGTIANGSSPFIAAIKRLDSTSNQGAHEFWAEVKMLSKLRHCHLVSLIGYCKDGQEMILVYEYMSHGTLEDHLHKCRYLLPWMRRVNICIEAARGLDYLHTGTGIKHGVVHRDVKSSNILLDNSWAAKISDFGLSKICPKNQHSTYVNTFVKGTFGYLDPDYFLTGKLTRKSDVYAFGVVLFEVLCGKRAVDESLDEEHWGLVRWVQDSIKEGRLKQIVDVSIGERNQIYPKCLKEFVRIADRCLHSHPKQRPTMGEVVVGLESVLALQVKANNTLQHGGVSIFGRKVPMVLFPSNGESSVGDPSLKSLELFLGSVGGENRMLCRFDFNTINDATENFSEANIISEDGNTSMYKGRLQNGHVKAIVQLQNYSHRAYKIYMNEALILLEIEHENLAQLLGYCIEGTKAFFVYDFAPYSSLDQLIFDLKYTRLDWNKLYKILLRVAKVLLYLHNIQIIHCDVKPENILLNQSLDPKLLGLGTAVTIAIDNETDCVVVDPMRGTLRYMSPESLSGLPISTKADVYSFGVSLLETVSGRRASHWYFQPSFTGYVLQNWLKGTFSNKIHPRIEVDLSPMTRFIEIGLLCTQEDAADRPTMEEVVDMLLGSSSLPLHVSRMRAQMIEESSDNDPIDDYDIDALEESLPTDDYDYDTYDYDTGAPEEFILDLGPR